MKEADIPEVYKRDGIVVHVECRESITESGQINFEVTLSAEGKSAIVDIPGYAEHELAERIDNAVSGFCETIVGRPADE